MQDANVAFVSLKVNAKGEALFTYRRSDGRLRHVLAWGALNARAPSQELAQVKFRWDYAGGWGKYRKGRYWKSFKNRCQPYDGPALALLVAACKAPNGTYWTVQAWQRRLPLLGFDPGFPPDELELHVAHFSGELPKLEVFPNWTYDGRWQGLFGRYSYLGQPIFGFGANAKGVPKDKYGRNLYIDTLNSPYGTGLAPRVRDPHAPRDRHVLSQLRPAAPVRGVSESGCPPGGRGREYRVTAGGPGVMPVMQVELAGLTRSDLRRDDEFNSVFDRVMDGDKTCAGER